MDKLSVVISIHDWAEYLEPCLQSVLHSTYRNVEVILVGEIAPDVDPALLAEFGDQIVHIVPSRPGLYAARNAGIAASTGEMIAMMDGKDITGRMRLELQVTRLLEQPRVGMVFCGMTFINADGSFLKGVFLTPDYRQEQFLGQLLERNCVGSVSTTVIRRSVVTDAGGFDEGFTTYGEYDLWLRISQVCAVDYLDLPLVRYRLVPAAMAETPEGLTEEIRHALSRHDAGAIAEHLARVHRQEQDFRLALGRVRLRMGEVMEALGHFQRVLSLHQENPQARFGIASCYYATGDYDQAQWWYQEAMACEPPVVPPRKRPAARQQTGAADPTLEAFRRSLELQTGDGLPARRPRASGPAGQRAGVTDRWSRSI